MEIQNPDLRTINQIVTDQKVEQINRDSQRTIYAVPGHSPIAPPKKRERSKYNDVQLQEAMDLAAIVGVKEAAKKTGVHEASIYKYAAFKGTTITRLKWPKKDIIVARRKYAASQLRETFERAMKWHENTGVGLRQCVERAAREAKINDNYLWALYCSKDSVLGFGGGL